MSQTCAGTQHLRAPCCAQVPVPAAASRRCHSCVNRRSKPPSLPLHSPPGRGVCYNCQFRGQQDKKHHQRQAASSRHAGECACHRRTRACTQSNCRKALQHSRLGTPGSYSVAVRGSAHNLCLHAAPLGSRDANVPVIQFHKTCHTCSSCSNRSPRSQSGRLYRCTLATVASLGMVLRQVACA